MEVLPFQLHDGPADLSQLPCAVLCIGLELIQNWHCCLLGLLLLRGYSVEAARPLIGYVRPVLLGKLVGLGIPLRPLPRFLPE